MARPPDDAEGPRTAKLDMRITVAQHTRWSAAAGADGLTLPDWAREKLDEAAWASAPARDEVEAKKPTKKTKWRTR